MSSTAVSSSLLQALDIIQHLSSQVILDLHIRQHGGQVEDLLVRQLADAAGRVDVEAGQEAGGGMVADSEESLEGFLFVYQVSLGQLIAAMAAERRESKGAGGRVTLSRFRSGKLTPRMKTFQPGVSGKNF